MKTNNDIDIKKIACNDELLEKSFLSAISQKPEKHHLDDGKYIIRGMSKIGG